MAAWGVEGPNVSNILQTLAYHQPSDAGHVWISTLPPTGRVKTWMVLPLSKHSSQVPHTPP